MRVLSSNTVRRATEIFGQWASNLDNCHKSGTLVGHQLDNGGIHGWGMVVMLQAMRVPHLWKSC